MDHEEGTSLDGYDVSKRQRSESKPEESAEVSTRR